MISMYIRNCKVTGKRDTNVHMYGRRTVIQRENVKPHHHRVGKNENLKHLTNKKTKNKKLINSEEFKYV